MKKTESVEPKAPQGEVTETELAKEWQSIDWQSAERTVGRMQARISKAMISNKREEILSGTSETWKGLFVLNHIRLDEKGWMKARAVCDESRTNVS